VVGHAGQHVAGASADDEVGAGVEPLGARLTMTSVAPASRACAGRYAAG